MKEEGARGEGGERRASRKDRTNTGKREAVEERECEEGARITHAKTPTERETEKKSDRHVRDRVAHAIFASCD